MEHRQMNVAAAGTSPPGRAPPGLLPIAHVRPQPRQQQQQQPPSIQQLQPRVPPSAGKEFDDDDSLEIPARLCVCMQNCTRRVTPEVVPRVCAYFKSIVEKSDQYEYLASLIQYREKYQQQHQQQQSNKEPQQQPQQQPQQDQPQQQQQQSNSSATVPNGGSSATPPPQKRIRMAAFRYFVPLVSERDLRRLRLHNQQQQPQDAQAEAGAASKWKPVNPHWDHAEVCLKAFVTIHAISEKRAIIARQTRQLRKYVRCSRPIPSHAYEQEMQRRRWEREVLLRRQPEAAADDKNGGDNNELDRADDPDEDDDYYDEDEGDSYVEERDLGRVLSDVRSWMAAERTRLHERVLAAEQLPVAAALPSGFVLPSSITCMPVAAKSSPAAAALDARQYYVALEQQQRDVDTVATFFAHQLWKPEYIGGAALK